MKNCGVDKYIPHDAYSSSHDLKIQIPLTALHIFLIVFFWEFDEIIEDNVNVYIWIKLTALTALIIDRVERKCY